jgi:hypothetical protein
LQQPNENVFKNITRDETWAYGYDVETKWHSSLWKSPESLWMVMICVFESEDSIDFFFWLYGIVLCKLIPVGQVHQLTQHVDLRILGKEFNSWSSTSLQLPDLFPPDFFLFPQNISDSERKNISNSRGHHYEWQMIWKWLNRTSCEQCF